VPIRLEQAIKVEGVQENLASAASDDTDLRVRSRFVMGSLAIPTREHIDCDCKAITWLTFRKNAAVSTPGEAQ
jgi:hypothetical protein